MSYKITIKRKNGQRLIKTVYSKSDLDAHIRQAKIYGDRVLSVEEYDAAGNFLGDVTKLVLTGAIIGVGLNILGGFIKK